MGERRRPRVLIADDREENRYVLARVLEGSGFDCTQAGTGHEALEIALTLPDLIILDVRLGDMSGYEVCRQIKTNPRTASISILQISASFVSSDDRVRALEGGADGYLTHPIDRMVLVATVRALLRLRAAETVAREAADHWQSTFDAMHEGVALVGKDGELIRWNRAFTEIVGSQIAIEAGENAGSLLERVVGTSEPMHKNGHRYGGEFVIAKRSVQLSVNPIQAGNPSNEKILILTDITDRKLAEYALRTAEKLAATGKMANAMAHEINNPLEALTNLIYLAQASSSETSIREFLSRADDELARIAKITKQSLAFHRDSQVPIPVQVNELVAEVCSMLQRSTATRHVRLVPEPIEPVTICGFPGQLTQVFVNLIRNAAEAAFPGTEVVIRTKPIRRRGREGALVAIHDRGAGIPENIRDNLFDPFFTTKELKGSGLGLWVSRILVMNHNGTIRFRTSERPGKSGTTFEVFLADVKPNADSRQG